MGGACSAYRLEDRPIHGFGGGNPQRKRPLEKPTRRSEDNIKMDLQEVEC